MKTGIYYNLPFSEYKAIPALNASLMKAFAKSPAHAMHLRTNPRKETAALQLGTHAHALILEPDRADYALEPLCNKRIKKNREFLSWYAEQCNALGRYIVTREQHDAAIAIADAVWSHPTASNLLNGDATEVTLVWVDPDTGLRCKARLDCRNGDTIVDVKTTRDASPHAFQRDAAKYGYHIQAAHYLNGAEVLGLGLTAFVFVAVETEPPYGIMCREWTDDALHHSAAIVSDIYERYAECLRDDTWPGYETGIVDMELPRWLRRDDDKPPDGAVPQSIADDLFNDVQRILSEDQ